MTERDAKLSALLDGELAPDEAAALRDEVARRPELATRLAELTAVDEALRALPARPVPAELRSRLEARIREEPPVALHGTRSRPPAAPRAEHREAVRSRARRWLAGAALAAAAAALALVTLPRLRESGGPGAEPVARTEPAPVPVPAPGARQAPTLVPEVMEERVAIAEQSPVPVPAPEAEAVPEAEPIPHDLLDPSDEPSAADVALAEDLPVIEVLDVLAELDELEGVGSG